MRLYIIRHGNAGVMRGKSGSPEDLVRKLTPDGREAVRAVAEWMKKKDEMPARILHSPAVRATETAKIVSSVVKVACEPCVNLHPHKPAEMLIRQLAVNGDRRVLLVGHKDNIEPGLANLNMIDDDDIMPFAQGELRIFKVDREDVTWKEKFSVTPSDLGVSEFDIF
jgi:phosphohistidine phosphatase SixA